MHQKIKAVKKTDTYGQRRSIMSLVCYMRVSFWTLVFALYFNFGISIVEIEIKMWTNLNHFKNTTRTWMLKRASG